MPCHVLEILPVNALLLTVLLLAQFAPSNAAFSSIAFALIKAAQRCTTP